jgi:hypothetical protein
MNRRYVQEVLKEVNDIIDFIPNYTRMELYMKLTYLRGMSFGLTQGILAMTPSESPDHEMPNMLTVTVQTKIHNTCMDIKNTIKQMEGEEQE